MGRTLVINDKYIINADIMDILDKLKSELFNGKLANYRQTVSGIRVTCPFHADGKEHHESCYIGEDGVFHCFTCGEKGFLDHFVALCFNESDSFGRNWLINNFGVEKVFDDDIYIPYININDQEEKVKYLDRSVLNKYEDWNEYLETRKLSKEVCKQFDIKYDPIGKYIVFPCNDSKGNLVMLTRRSTVTKQFYIDRDVEKPVYCLDYIIKNNIDKVIVCESQINCLYAWSLGYPAVALFGTGTQYQYDLLNKSGIVTYILAFDGDDAGDKGADRFIKNINKDALIVKLNIPREKDLNDLEKEEVFNLINNKKYVEL